MAVASVGVREDGDKPYLVIAPVMFGLYCKYLCGCAFRSSTESYTSDVNVYNRVIVLEKGEETDLSDLETDKKLVLLKYDEQTMPLLIVTDISKKIMEWCANE